MIDLGYLALLLALVISVYAALAAFWGKRFDYPGFLASARNGVYAVGGLLTVAALALIYALVTHDFQVEYVASYTSLDLPLFYALSAFWAGQAGSLLLWAWLLALFSVIVVLQNRRDQELLPYVISILMGIEIFFLVLMIMTTNPLHRLDFVPSDGQGMNPLLQNPGMIFHPPATYLGYVGFAVPFAFAMAALFTGRLDEVWIRTTRRWTLLSWLFLSIGVGLGAQWAYVELGWGGYWAWDPVENASLLPWLTGTAFLHSAMIQERRGMLKVWNLALVALTFLLSIFGTFITRSGIVESVHSFGVSTLGPYFLAFLGLVTVSFLFLLFDRLPSLRSENTLDSLLSRESTFLLNNLILLGAAFATFWGTIFPMVSEAVTGNKITVGAPFYNQVNGPIFLTLVLLVGICPLISWRRASKENLLRNFSYPLVVSLAVAGFLFLLGVREWYALLSFTVCAFVMVTILSEFYRGLRARRRLYGENHFSALINLLRRHRRRYGGYIVHLGVVLLTIGVVGSTLYKAETEAHLNPGERVSLKGYSLEFQGLSQYATRNRTVLAANLELYQGDRLLGTMTPERAFYRKAQEPTTEVDIRTTLKEDLYLILAGVSEDGSATFKVIINPLVAWIWVGGMVLIG
ncbi:MAG: heme lyase CcmF/NrfE family subunit, partial [Anaerolineae bacterium]